MFLWQQQRRLQCRQLTMPKPSPKPQMARPSSRMEELCAVIWAAEGGGPGQQVEGDGRGGEVANGRQVSTEQACSG